MIRKLNRLLDSCTEISRTVIDYFNEIFGYPWGTVIFLHLAWGTVAISYMIIVICQSH